MADGKGVMVVWIIDEAQNLPLAFFRDLQAVFNFLRPDSSREENRDLWRKSLPRKRHRLKNRPDPIQIKAIERPLDEERHKVAICSKPLVQRFQNHDSLHRTLVEALKHGDPSAPEELFSPC